MRQGFGSNGRSRGYAILYRQGVANFCPGCTHTNWYIGRHVAECAFCGTVLPLRDDTGGRAGWRSAA